MIEIVVCRYEDSLDWFKLLRSVDKFTVYDKSFMRPYVDIYGYDLENDPGSFPSSEERVENYNEELRNNKITDFLQIEKWEDDKIISLPNYGVDDHAILYHIVHNYERLSDLTIFVQEYFLDQCRDIIDQINELDKNSKGFIPFQKKVLVGGEDMLSKHPKKLGYYEDHKLDLKSFWNTYLKKELGKMPHPFIHFPNAFFAVDRDSILKHPLGFYADLKQSMDIQHHQTERAHTTVGKWSDAQKTDSRVDFYLWCSSEPHMMVRVWNYIFGYEIPTDWYNTKVLEWYK
jgi:hypothetical protein|tara:strand:- start:1270 stop:2133 length:864 start_codon:yes stop_codon:yes gene_type:complete